VAQASLPAAVAGSAGICRRHPDPAHRAGVRHLPAVVAAVTFVPSAFRHGGMDDCLTLRLVALRGEPDVSLRFRHLRQAEQVPWGRLGTDKHRSLREPGGEQS